MGREKTYPPFEPVRVTSDQICSANAWTPDGQNNSNLVLPAIQRGLQLRLFNTSGDLQIEILILHAGAICADAFLSGGGRSNGIPGEEIVWAELAY